MSTLLLVLLTTGVLIGSARAEATTIKSKITYKKFGDVDCFLRGKEWVYQGALNKFIPCNTLVIASDRMDDQETRQAAAAILLSAVDQPAPDPAKLVKSSDPFLKSGEPLAKSGESLVKSGEPLGKSAESSAKTPDSLVTPVKLTSEAIKTAPDATKTLPDSSAPVVVRNPPAIRDRPHFHMAHIHKHDHGHRAHRSVEDQAEAGSNDTSATMTSRNVSSASAPMTPRNASGESSETEDTRSANSSSSSNGETNDSVKFPEVDAGVAGRSLSSSNKTDDTQHLMQSSTTPVPVTESTLTCANGPNFDDLLQVSFGYISVIFSRYSQAKAIKFCRSHCLTLMRTRTPLPYEIQFLLDSMDDGAGIWSGDNITCYKSGACRVTTVDNGFHPQDERNNSCRSIGKSDVGVYRLAPCDERKSFVCEFDRSIDRANVVPPPFLLMPSSVSEESIKEELRDDSDDGESFDDAVVEPLASKRRFKQRQMMQMFQSHGGGEIPFGRPSPMYPPCQCHLQNQFHQPQLQMFHHLPGHLRGQFHQSGQFMPQCQCQLQNQFQQPEMVVIEPDELKLNTKKPKVTSNRSKVRKEEVAKEGSAKKAGSKDLVKEIKTDKSGSREKDNAAAKERKAFEKGMAKVKASAAKFEPEVSADGIISF